jgi:hypothetical protein
MYSRNDPEWSFLCVYFWCRGRDSNPHGAFAPENFKAARQYCKVLWFTLRREKQKDSHL